jgi:hypothetical protein
VYRELALEKAMDLWYDRLRNERMVHGEDDKLCNFSIYFSKFFSYFLVVFGIHILLRSVLKHPETDILL